MSYIKLKQPDGQWCIWSTVTEDWVLRDATREEVIQHHLENDRARYERQRDEIEEDGGDWYAPPVSYEELVERHEE